MRDRLVAYNMWSRESLRSTPDDGEVGGSPAPPPPPPAESIRKCPVVNDEGGCRYWLVVPPGGESRKEELDLLDEEAKEFEELVNFPWCCCCCWPIVNAAFAENLLLNMWRCKVLFTSLEALAPIMDSCWLRETRYRYLRNLYNECQPAALSH